jgi:hypothetical protein
MARSRKKRKCLVPRGCEAPPGACPINGLPDETLLQTLLLSRDEDSIEIFDKSVLAHPFLAVCRRWRGLILNAPRFWKNITLRIASRPWDPGDNSRGRSIFALRQVKKQIELVKNVPANIEFAVILTHASKELSGLVYERLTKLFQECLPQMRLLSYQENYYSGLWNILNSGKGNKYQDLTHLTLRCPNYCESKAELSPMPSAKNYTELPSLRVLQLIEWYMEFPGTLSGFRAPKLNTLLLLNLASTVLSIPGLLDDLQKFPELHTLRLCTDAGIEGVSSLSLDHQNLSLRHLSLMSHLFNPYGKETVPFSLTRLLGAFPGLQKLILRNLYHIRGDVMTQEVANFTFTELQIESDICPTSPRDWLTEDHDGEMDRFLSVFHHVQCLQLGSDEGRYPTGSQDIDDNRDVNCPSVIWMDLIYVLTFLARPCLNGDGFYLPSLKVIILSKITFMIMGDTCDLIKDILRERNGTNACRITLRGCMWFDRLDWHNRYRSFPDFEGLSFHEFEFAYGCYLEDLSNHHKRKGRRPKRGRMFLFDGTNVKLIGDLHAAALQHDPSPMP